MTIELHIDGVFHQSWEMEPPEKVRCRETDHWLLERYISEALRLCQEESVALIYSRNCTWYVKFKSQNKENAILTETKVGNGGD